ncbi:MULTISPECIES: hypothetical protein [unclassified Nocardia]|uniref:hypothetical protein n=1 Tax=unclassified Nocardia TaxID=2637762 RepID=UPI00278BEF55|nr:MULTISPECIES: hypothetical protein [unclassified Nocardia]
MLNTVRNVLLALCSVAALTTLTAPPAAANISGVETWQAYPWQQVTQVDAGVRHKLVAVMVSPLQTYGRVWFYDNGRLITTGYPNYGASDIQVNNGRRVAISPDWTPTAGTHEIEARQCGDSACSWRVQFYTTTVIVS